MTNNSNHHTDEIFKEKRKVTTFSNNLKSEYNNATTIIEHIRSIKGDLI